MLEGLSEKEFNELLLSVGGTPIARRPYSPVEVGRLCERAETAGATRRQITEALHMKDVSIISKFIAVARLAPRIQHFIWWGRSGRGAIGFSTAAQLSRLDGGDQELMAKYVLKFDFTKAEMISINQLLKRSGDPLDRCVNRVVNRRPVLSVRHIVLGAISSSKLQQALALKTQRERNSLLYSAVLDLYPKVKNFTAKLGTTRFAIVGGKSLADNVGQDKTFEATVCGSLAERID